jgi:hypothetical protein
MTYITLGDAIATSEPYSLVQTKLFIQQVPLFLYSFRLLVKYITESSFQCFCTCFSVPCHAIEKDYYEILGISKDASQDDIKKAFLTVSNLGHCFIHFIYKHCPVTPA